MLRRAPLGRSLSTHFSQNPDPEDLRELRSLALVYPVGSLQSIVYTEWNQVMKSLVAAHQSSCFRLNQQENENGRNCEQDTKTQLFNDSEHTLTQVQSSYDTINTRYAVSITLVCII